MWIPFFTTRKTVAARSIPALPVPAPGTPVDFVLSYHEQTKHHIYRFARSVGYLDWDNQPNPFRRFEGAPFHRLPLLPLEESPSYEELYESIAPPQPVSIETISRLFRHSLAISAWKCYEGTRWALRVNPSSGNLHPTEGYVILNRLESGDFPAGVYHYAPEEHGLERRATVPQDIITKLGQDFPQGTFFVGFSSIHWREAWKYGERAYRYCQHDQGHAIAAMRFSACMLGWQVFLLEELSDQDIATLLGLNRDSDFHQAEDEYPHCIVAVIPSAEPISREATFPENAIQDVASAEWRGHANRLSESHVEWEIIDEVARNTGKARMEINQQPLRVQLGRIGLTTAHSSAAGIIQQRRSALGFDRSTFISAKSFYHILSRTLPDFSPVPFDLFTRSVLHRPRIHLAIFVIRVEGLEPGCYILVRDPQKLQELKSAMYPRFEWSSPQECPAELPFYRMETGDVAPLAVGVSCGQDIAGAGVFSLGMIAEFEEPLRSVGPWLYPRLFWEAGLVGQILYLEAEAAGIRATGIGCFFDDPMHETLGLKDKRFQSLYHFTLGGPVEDERLTTDPPYDEGLVGLSQSRLFNPDLP